MNRKSSSPAAEPLFLHSFCLNFEPGWAAARHAHEDFWEMLLVTQGAMRVSTPERETVGTVGAVYIYPPGYAHQEACVSQVELKLSVLLWRFGTSSQGDCLPRETLDKMGHVENALSWMEELQRSTDAREPMITRLLELVLFECSRARAQVKTSRIDRVIAHVRENLSEALTVPDLARVARMSESHFSHEFRKQTGFSPVAYVRKLRLDAACKAIAGTDTVFREIARETGFRDEFEFSRVFRRVMGFPPASLRRRGGGAHH